MMAAKLLAFGAVAATATGTQRAGEQPSGRQTCLSVCLPLSLSQASDPSALALFLASTPHALLSRSPRTAALA